MSSYSSSGIDTNSQTESYKIGESYKEFSESQDDTDYLGSSKRFDGFGSVRLNDTRNSMSLSSDISDLEKQSEHFITKALKLSKEESISSRTTDEDSTDASTVLYGQLQKLDVISWYKSWKNKKREAKVQAIYQNLIPRLQDASDRLKSWLNEVMDYKRHAVSSALALLEEMIAAADISQSHVDMYDDIFNDCLQIGCDLKKEIIELKGTLEFSKEILSSGKKPMSEEKICEVYHRCHKPSFKSRERNIQSRMNANAALDDRIVVMEPAVWHGYHGQEGKNIHIAKSPGIASLVEISVESSKSSKHDEDTIVMPRSNRSVSEPQSPREIVSPSDTSKLMSSFFSGVFPSVSSPASDSSRPCDNGSTLDSLRQFKLSSLITRRRSLSGASDGITPPQSTRNRSTSSSPMVGMKSIGSCSSSLNSQLQSFNTNACTAELDTLFEESDKLLEATSDIVIEDLIERMKRLKLIKDSVAKFIREIQLAKEDALLNKKKCRQIQSELESVIHCHNGATFDLSNFRGLCESPPLVAGSESRKLPLQRGISLTGESIKKSESRNSVMSGLSSDIIRMSPGLDRSYDHHHIAPLSDINSNSPTSTSDGRLSPFHFHHDISTLSDDHTSHKGINLIRNSRRPSTGSHGSGNGSHEYKSSSMDLSSASASQAIDDLKTILAEEELVKKQLGKVEQLLHSTSSCYSPNV